MAEQLDRLLFIEKPYIDESLTGYLLRLAELNFVSRLNWILKKAEIKRNIFGSSYPGITNNDDLTQLAQLCGTSEATFNSWRYQIDSEFRSNLKPRYLIFSNSLPSFFIIHQHSRLCILCLKEQNYIQQIWEFAPITVCLQHQCLLIDTCNKCKALLKWNRSHVSQCICGHDCKGDQPVFVDEGEMRMANHICSLFNLKPFRRSPKLALPENIRELTHISFFRLLFLFASSYAQVNDLTGKELLTNMSNSDLHNSLQSVIVAFDDFPNNFFFFLDWLKHQKVLLSPKSVRYDCYADILKNNRKFTEELRVLVRYKLDFSQYNFIQEAFDQYTKSGSKPQLNKLFVNHNPIILAKIYAGFIKKRQKTEDWD